MAIDTRKKNANWRVTDSNGAAWNVAYAQLAVLMDVRDELQELNRLLHCPAFTDIPATLRRIHRKIPARQPRKRRA